MWGQRQRDAHWMRVAEEHPHVCGDNSMLAAMATSLRGTPPRMWGQRRALTLACKSIWNTPTYVGTTAGAEGGGADGQEHPHVCGDNFRPHHAFPAVLRNTPTYVGTTLQRHPRHRQREEHPHVCGDNEAVRARVDAGGGTPPRMWGQRKGTEFSATGDRNTPTYVGTTPAKCAHSAGSAGTPPRMWGQP